jgi:hypothetical protein
MERAGAMATYNASLIGPLVAELSETRIRLVAQAEEIGSLRAQLDAAQQTIKALQAPKPQESPVASNPGPIGENTPREPSEPPSPTPMPPTPNGSGRTAWWRRWLEAIYG